MKSAFKSNLALLCLVTLSSCNFFCHEKDVIYFENEPYQDWEEIKIEATYKVYNAYHRRVPGFILSNPKIEAGADIENTSNFDGNFTYEVNYRTLNDTIRFKDTKFIKAHSMETISFEKELEPYTQFTIIDGYRVTPPVSLVRKQITKFRKVKKYRKCNSCDDNCTDELEFDSTKNY